MANLSATIAKVQRVVVLLAASDVTLLQVSTPPLSAARLKAALPNLVEDQLLGNPADCVVVASNALNGLRTVAIVQRAWLEQVCKAFAELGARHISVLPAQLCLPHQAGRVVAAITQGENEVDLTLRLSEQTGMGLALSAHQPEEVIQSLRTIVSNAPITLYVPQAHMRTYQVALNNIGLDEHINIAADVWSMWIAGARNTTLNLITGLNSESGIKMEWRPWRWSLILAIAALLVNILALNFDWWQMKSEAKNLRNTMTQIYQARYPKETVVIDPIAQMQQKIAFAKRDAGLATPNDFTVLAATFGEVWSNTASTDKPTIESLKYREHALVVSFKADSNNNSDALTQPIKTALASRNLSLSVEPAESGAVSWQIRSAK